MGDAVKLLHESRYPGLDVSKFRRLVADPEYQEAVATHGKMLRHNVQTTRHSGQVTTSWVCELHRSLEQKPLRPLKRLWPNGIVARWRETHAYHDTHGTMRLQVLQPSLAAAVVEGVETLLMQGDTLVRRLEVDLGRTKLTLPLRLIPGVKKGIASEVERGLARADACTAQWLKDHPGRYDRHVHTNP